MQDLIPKDPNFSDQVLEYSDNLHDFLSDLAQKSINLNRVPRNQARKERFLEAMAQAFEIIGGVPRLALWADANPTEFYKILGKQVPVLVQNAIAIKANGPVTIISAIPPSPLDENDGKVVASE